jgi:hypothetical protein
MLSSFGVVATDFVMHRAVARALATFLAHDDQSRRTRLFSRVTPGLTEKFAHDFLIVFFFRR